MLCNAEEKILCRSLFSTLTQSTVCTQGSREKGRFTRGWKTAGCLPSCAPAARSGNFPARRSVRNPLPWVRQPPPPPFGGPPPPFRGGFRSVQTVLNDIYPFLNAKNRGQMPSVSCFIARYAKNYFFRTTSPPRPVCAVMYSRPILAYSNGLALAGSCSASTMIQPV